MHPAPYTIFADQTKGMVRPPSTLLLLHTCAGPVGKRMSDKGPKSHTDKHKKCGYIGYHPAQAKMINAYDRGYNIIDIDRQDHQEHYNARGNQDYLIKLCTVIRFLS